jgi:hypothetical protein
MARKLDPVIVETLKKYGFGPEACWDCHGTWVVLHRPLEQIAATAGIKFDPPLVLEARGDAKCVALCVTGRMGDAIEWSVGEAAPGNNKNAYPYAMAEKRGKDRVILKMIGLHGLAYSSEEFDGAEPPRDTAPPEPEPEPAPRTTTKIKPKTPPADEFGLEPHLDMAESAVEYVKLACAALKLSKSRADLLNWWAREKDNRAKHRLSPSEEPGLDLVMAYEDMKETFATK